MSEEQLPQGVFASRLDALFKRTKNPRNDKEYSVREVAAAVRLSHTHVGRLRAGRADPRLTEMEALAEFFGVSLSYFTDPDPPARQSHRQQPPVEERLLDALRDPTIKTVALRMADADLSTDGQDAVLAMIEHVIRLERGRPPEDAAAEHKRA